MSQLSGGQKQRIAIARCMVLEPDVLLLNEPLGALDLKLRERMKIELKLLQHQFNTTFLYITHDQSEALVMSDNVAVMNAGKFEQIGTPQELYHRPGSGFVAGFVGDSNRWRGRVASSAGGVCSIEVDGGTVVAASSGPLARGEEVEVLSARKPSPSARRVQPTAATGWPVRPTACCSTAPTAAPGAQRVGCAAGGRQPGGRRGHSASARRRRRIELRSRAHPVFFRCGQTMTSADARRLSLILLFAPFFLWIAVLIVLPQLGIVGVSLREKVGPGEYVFGFANYMDFLGQPIYWNTLLRTAVMSILVTAGHGSPPRAGKRQSRLHLPGDGELGTLALLLAFGLLAGPQGGYGFETIRAAEHSPLVVALVLGLMLLGAGSKAGLVPLHVWLPLVVLGQFSFLTTITSLVIAARLRKFDIALEEAALNLGAGRGRVLATITIPYLMPALVSAFIVAFLVSFENFNTTLMLVGSEAPLTITMYDRVAKVGSTPVLNAVSPSSA